MPRLLVASAAPFLDLSDADLSPAQERAVLDALAHAEDEARQGAIDGARALEDDPTGQDQEWRDACAPRIYGDYGASRSDFYEDFHADGF